MPKITSFFSPKGRSKRFPSPITPIATVNDTHQTTASSSIQSSTASNKSSPFTSSSISKRCVEAAKIAPFSPTPPARKLRKLSEITLSGCEDVDALRAQQLETHNLLSKKHSDHLSLDHAVFGSPMHQSPARSTLNSVSKLHTSTSSTSKRTLSKDNDTKEKWLSNPRDQNRRSPGDEGYDPRTLYIPESAFRSMTPGQVQFWRIKAQNFDVVIFFKQGRFYELFDMDAEIGNRELDLVMMKGARAHVGFPESSFSKYAEKLVHLGYKVGRVEQTETPAELKERKIKTGSKDKAVNRELVSLLTKGTLVDGDIIGNDHSSFLISLCEHCNDDEQQYGVSIIDTSTGHIKLGQFHDDTQRTRLRTLIAQLRPEEVVFPRGQLSLITEQIFEKDLRVSTLINGLEQQTEFWTADRTWTELTQYYGDDEAKFSNILHCMKTQQHHLALSALGGAIWYLRRALLDTELLSIARFSCLDISDSDTISTLMLDAQTLANLDVLENQDGGTSGSLLSFLDHCSTPFGRRLLREWLSKPLFHLNDINARLDAVEDLMQFQETADDVRSSLKQLPDLARLLSRIHAYGVGRDSKAVMYENIHAKQLGIFLNVLEALRKAMKTITRFSTLHKSMRSQRLQWLTTCGEGAGFPEYNNILDKFDSAFDQNRARAEGIVIPAVGIDETYDDATSKVTNIEKCLQTELTKLKAQLNDRSISFVHRNKERYQIEISINTLDRVGGAPQKCEHLGERKGFRRFWTPELRNLVEKLDVAETVVSFAVQGIIRRIFSSFCQHHALWTRAVDSLAELDCLLSFATTSKYSDGVMCRPNFVVSSSSPILELRESRHPALMHSSPHFIPNDTLMSCVNHHAVFGLVTGPNMGGKSTLLRQTCIAVLIAQLGCYVPASSFTLSPVDRIFTRVGASDRILKGQSTFFVELEETSTILRHATSHSLVILDELGRGTSTFDGTAIAWAVANYLSHTTLCRTLFSTHYHLLSSDFANDSSIQNYHMAFHLDENTNSLTFLYKFQKGICSKSFGLNVARMAGLPHQILERASSMATQFENKLKVAHMSKSMNNSSASLHKLSQYVSNRDVKSLREWHSRLREQCSE